MNFLKVFSIFLFSVSCGAEAPEEDPDFKHSCIDDLAACEFIAKRRTSSMIVYWIEQRKCSVDHGRCANSDVDCKEWCNITHSPSACEDSCFWSTRSTKTSTTSD